ncbi:5'-methylthioadenosine/adenosylhomocysteine nucleosidase [Lactiplantibacillus mudanjiangensis]|uniref:adenosylhomocysteine nucleosidase n=1 Tax=Lactiplantibacillus mudanjiangensis TaxID=1296538 RepID=A0A660E5K9_9LACO|nr:5'-methylthioadenosine/adenosylhomocysteine nucleosidase [Lactiplantibacillus mudanjiangensis]VDG20759.1 5'-methylthioadenosine/S-adenosylhomocysteine nucleosidase [Lactobacillus pentosus] [Lactiplantibacillus mudanjiangensis]VDG24452.1 5'-methylthioadenosine/S-adenosylhomocysteine nucleosidase [Lactobacillus pentosus] [Lactiplantibacillus mudanjiangensis]VDG30076.1 5'-methylthioadenosine/S-adenosylhomocysteine nucleosidase [Lactobacillus pentosus] [Lactiplantibacillus mudanjiangensis]VDG305
MKFGIICAMEEELKTLREALQGEQIKPIKDITFYEGTIDNQAVVLVQSGIGKVQAGMTTALMITNFDVDVVINSGSAGGIGQGLSVGDVVVATATAYHDADATAFGYEYGQLPQQPLYYETDTNWVNQIVAAAKATGLHAKTGLIVSGDQFIAGKAATDKILAHFPKALSSEMEGAAIGQACHQFNTPYVVIRAMSDVGDEDAGVSFDEFILAAGKQSAAMLLALFAAQNK